MTNEVLIVGAGPSGLFAAAEFIRHGLRVRLIERDAQPHREARATTIQAGTLEILDSVGLLPAFLEASEHVRFSRIYDSDMTELRGTTYQGLDCRCDFQCVLPQYETQRILEEHLTSLGGKVERSVTATKPELDADGVLVELIHADGHAETVQTSLVVGAGGAQA
jgi:6-methylpretetramide 4-monooxygenase / 4-hydroxy-6-methylpretetramide 12a-monooxygenase